MINKTITKYPKVDKIFSFLPYITFIKCTDIINTHEVNNETGEGKFSSNGIYYTVWNFGWLWFNYNCKR